MVECLQSQAANFMCIHWKLGWQIHSYQIPSATLCSVGIGYEHIWLQSKKVIFWICSPMFSPCKYSFDNNEVGRLSDVKNVGLLKEFLQMTVFLYLCV